MNGIKLLLATRNQGKIREFKDLLPPEVDVLTAEDLGLDLEVAETAPDYRSNASAKALAYAAASGHWSLADDSGLEVDALGGAPGLHSARLAGEGKGDADRRRRLLELLAPHPRPWTARFRSTLALASPRGAIDFAEGICPGQIIPQERGAGGFGYDPIFLLEDQAITMAELEVSAKNMLSHRARAFKSLAPRLYRSLGLDVQNEDESAG